MEFSVRNTNSYGKFPWRRSPWPSVQLAVPLLEMEKLISFFGFSQFSSDGAELAFEVLVILYSKDFHEITQNEHFHTQVWTPFEVFNGYQGALRGVCRTGVIQATWACSSVKETPRPHTPTIAEPRWRTTSYVPVQSEGYLLRPGVLVAEVKIIILPSPV